MSGSSNLVSIAQRTFPIGWFARAITASSTFDLDIGTATSITAGRYILPAAAKLRSISFEMLTAITTGTLGIHVWLDGSDQTNFINLVTASGARGVWALESPVALPNGSGLHFKGVATAGTFPTSLIINPSISFD